MGLDIRDNLLSGALNFRVD
uniref:Uncharacterized protein n=1 Tax=Anguilla anguilla TaxID=7936 RepID=A0A0E9QKB2_ANGAN